MTTLKGYPGHQDPHASSLPDIRVSCLTWQRDEPCPIPGGLMWEGTPRPISTAEPLHCLQGGNRGWEAETLCRSRLQLPSFIDKEAEVQREGTCLRLQNEAVKPSLQLRGEGPLLNQNYFCPSPCLLHLKKFLLWNTCRACPMEVAPDSKEPFILQVPDKCWKKTVQWGRKVGGLKDTPPCVKSWC